MANDRRRRIDELKTSVGRVQAQLRKRKNTRAVLQDLLHAPPPSDSGRVSDEEDDYDDDGAAGSSSLPRYYRVHSARSLRSDASDTHSGSPPRGGRVPAPHTAPRRVDPHHGSASSRRQQPRSHQPAGLIDLYPRSPRHRSPPHSAEEEAEEVRDAHRLVFERTAASTNDVSPPRFPHLQSAVESSDDDNGDAGSALLTPAAGGYPSGPRGRSRGAYDSASTRTAGSSLRPVTSSSLSRRSAATQVNAVSAAAAAGSGGAFCQCGKTHSLTHSSSHGPAVVEDYCVHCTTTTKPSVPSYMHPTWASTPVAMRSSPAEIDPLARVQAGGSISPRSSRSRSGSPQRLHAQQHHQHQQRYPSPSAVSSTYLRRGSGRGSSPSPTPRRHPSPSPAHRVMSSRLLDQSADGGGGGGGGGGFTQWDRLHYEGLHSKKQRLDRSEDELAERQRQREEEEAWHCRTRRRDRSRDPVTVPTTSDEDMYQRLFRNSEAKAKARSKVKEREEVQREECTFRPNARRRSRSARTPGGDVHEHPTERLYKKRLEKAGGRV